MRTLLRGIFWRPSYDVAGWARHASPLSETAPHHRGPAKVQSKVFVRTGNTRYGVQNLSYDPALQRWFLGMYQGKKPAFPNYLLFAVDALEKPVRRDLVGVPGPDGKDGSRACCSTSPMTG